MKPGRMERWRGLWADLRAARLTWLLLFVLCLVQAVVALLGQPDWIYGLFGLSRQGLAAGNVWQLITHALLHGPWWDFWWHLAINGIALLVAGAKIERIANGAAFLKTFAAGVLAGGLAQLAVTPDSTQVLIGASGGIFALVFWLLAIHPGERMWPIPVSGRNLAIGLLLAEVGMLVAAWLAPGSVSVALGSGCHLGGGICGWLLARHRLGRLLNRDDIMKERARREANPSG